VELEGAACEAIDGDGDGVALPTDCDDGDPDVWPGAPEVVADGVDQDCDGGDWCYVDSDGDAVGEGAAAEGGDLDCDDAAEAPVDGDACLGFDDRQDADGDGIPDGCEAGTTAGTPSGGPPSGGTQVRTSTGPEVHTGGCACAHAPPAGGWLLGITAAAAVCRRRPIGTASGGARPRPPRSPRT
jgi:MYXO-CTERM domain-containing protein